jgi:peptidoglycan/LPS O-acetylase OafA/YrhL
VPALDGLRGCAVLAVLAVHTNTYFGGTFANGRVAGPLASLLGAGWAGVDLFFVLSGFLITGILLDAKGSAGYFRNFYARRALRIMPIYYGFLAAYVLLGRVDRTYWTPRPVLASLAGYYYNFRAALRHAPAENLHAFWSLCVEEHFYVAWPAVVLLSSRRGLCRIAAGLIVASLACRVAVVAAGGWVQVAYLVTPCRFDGLAAGALVAAWLRDDRDWAVASRFARPAALATGMFLLGLWVGQRHLSDYVDLRYVSGPAVDSSAVVTVGLTAFSVLFGACLVLLLNANPRSLWRRALERPAARAAGKYSYGMYVLHSLILGATVRALGRVLSPQRLANPLWKPAVFAWLACATFVAAWLSWHLYERHWLGIKRHFEYRASRTVPLPSAAGP